MNLVSKGRFWPPVAIAVAVALLVFVSPVLRLASAQESHAPTATKSHTGAETKSDHGAAPGGHAAPGGAEDHGASEQPAILELKPEMALATLIVFLLLLGVLYRFAWGPLSKALDARERAQEETVARAEAARAESERLLAEHKARMTQTADEVAAILARARTDAEASATALLARAQKDAEETKQRAERDIGQARDQALLDIWSKTADVAVSVAGKVLGKELKDDDHWRLVQAAIDELPAASTNGHGGTAR
jgi:F-type H+-transporting ATPase subunit b